MQTLTPGDRNDSPDELPIDQRDVPFSFNSLMITTDAESVAALAFATDLARQMGVKLEQFVFLLGDLSDTFAHNLKSDFIAGAAPRLSSEKYSLVMARLRALGWLRA